MHARSCDERRDRFCDFFVTGEPFPGQKNRLPPGACPPHLRTIVAARWLRVPWKQQTPIARESGQLIRKLHLNQATLIGDPDDLNGAKTSSASRLH